MAYSEKQYLNRLRKLAELEEMASSIAEQIEAVKFDIQQNLETDKISTKDFSISYTEVHSHRFDSKRFKEEHEKMYEQYQVPNDYMRFSYKLK